MKIRLLVFLLLLSIPASAQHYLLREDFNGYKSYVLEGNWDFSSFSGNWFWLAKPNYRISVTPDAFPDPCFLLPDHSNAPGTTGYENRTAYICDCVEGGDNSNVLLQSPSLNLTGATHAYLDYDGYFLQAATSGSGEKARVEVSVDSGATWQLLQDVPVNPSSLSFQTYHLPLDAFCGHSAVRIGFRYSDGGGDATGWAVDNVAVYTPTPGDVQLTHIDPDDDDLSGYTVIGDKSNINVTVYNAGAAPVEKCRLHYRYGNTGAVFTDTVATAIPALGTQVVTLAHPFTVKDYSRVPVKVWVAQAGDTVHANDTLTTSVCGAAFMPLKITTVEEGCGAWNMFAPRSYVILKALAGNDLPSTIISVHKADGMAQADYQDFLFDLNQYYSPFILLDRRFDARPETVFNDFDRERRTFGFADIEIGQLSRDYSKLTVPVTIKPAIPLSGNYRLALVLTEDSLHSPDSAWVLNNIYYNSPVPMEPFNQLPRHDTDYSFDYVARSIAPTPDGLGDCLPAVMQPGQDYTATLTGVLRPYYQVKNLWANILLIDSSSGAVLNSSRIALKGLDSIYSHINDTVVAARDTADFYISPNPAVITTTATVTTTAAVTIAIRVMDASGREVYSTGMVTIAAGKTEIPLPVKNWPDGIYFVSYRNGKEHKVLKLLVLD